MEPEMRWPFWEMLAGRYLPQGEKLLCRRRVKDREGWGQRSLADGAGAVLAASWWVARDRGPFLVPVDV